MYNSVVEEVKGLPYKQVTKIEWRQSSGLLAPDVTGYKGVSCEYKTGRHESMDRKSADMILSKFAGLRKGCGNSLMQGGKADSTDELFTVGATDFNEFGELNGWSTEKEGSVFKVELYAMNYGTKAQRRRLGLNEKTGFEKFVDNVKDILGAAAYYVEDDEDELNSDDEDDDKEDEEPDVPKQKPGAAITLARTVAKAVLKVEERPEEAKSCLQIYRNYTVEKMTHVPAECLIRQCDGSVGFFVQPKPEKEKRVDNVDVVTLDEDLKKCRAEVSEVTLERTSLEQEYEATLEKQGGEVNPETLQRYQEELAEVDARLAELHLQEGTLEAQKARQTSSGFPGWRAALAEQCRTVGMEAMGFALEENFDVNALAWPRFVPVIRLIRHRGCGDLCSWAKCGVSPRVKYTMKYQKELAGFTVRLRLPHASRRLPHATAFPSAIDPILSPPRPCCPSPSGLLMLRRRWSVTTS